MRSLIGGWVSNKRCDQPSWCCNGSSMHIATVAWLKRANGLSFCWSFGAMNQPGRVAGEVGAAHVGELLASVTAQIDSGPTMNATT